MEEVEFFCCASLCSRGTLIAAVFRVFLLPYARLYPSTQ